MSIDIPYTDDEQRELILAKVKLENDRLQGDSSGEVIEACRLIRKDNQVFAMFDGHAFEVSDVVSAVDSGQVLHRHACIGEQSFYCHREDGHGGVLTWQYLPHRSAWTLSWCSRRRVCAKEPAQHWREYVRHETSISV